jgi:transketolase
VVEVDGHDVAALHSALSRIPLEANKPTAIIAHTIKGKGVSFMEGQIAWHYKAPSDEELERALAEIAAG